VTAETIPDQAQGAKSRTRRVGLGVLLTSVVVLVSAAVMLGIRVVPAFTQATLQDGYRLPMDATLTLDSGTWVVFERTGRYEQRGPITVTTNKRTRLTPQRVSVTDAAGEPVPTSQATSTQTIDRDGSVYTGAVAFEVARDGQYHLTVSGNRGHVLVARDIFGVFASSLVWLLLIVVALVGCITGVALIVTGRRRERPSGDRPAPPGWYPNPDQPQQILWWDGTRWHLPADS
jgi:hypothetical protein